jgi:outer membrane biosynthesis protein TonB
MMISIFFLLFIFGGGAALLGLIVFAIVSKKLWIIPVGGALLFLGLIALGILPAIALAPHRSVTLQMPSPTQVIGQVSGMTHTVVQGPPNFNAYVSGPNWSRILIFGLLIAFLLGLAVRRGISPAAGRGLRRIGTAIAVILLIGFIFLFTFRAQYENSRATEAVQQATAEMVARQQSMFANQRAHIESQVSPQLAQMDIHKEMDQFDAPHIPLSPEAPEAPTAPTPTAEPPAVAKQNNKSAAKKNNDDTTKSAAPSNHKRKKSDKTPTNADTKQPQSVAQSKPLQEKLAAKENTTPRDNLAMVAEAESDNPKSRPAWVDEAPKRTRNIRREVIATGPYATIDECYQAVDVYLLLKAYERIQQLAGRPYSEGPLPSLTFRNGAILADGKLMSYGRGNTYWDEPDPRLRQLSDMGIGADYLRREIVAMDPRSSEAREFIETVKSTVGPMKTLYLQIEFTPEIDRDLLRHWDTHERRERFEIVGVGAGSMLGFISLVFGLLKIDTWTKGYYTKRLFIGVPAAIIAGLLLVSLLLGARPMRSESGPTVPLPQGYSN